MVDDNGVFQSGSGDWGACGPCECGTGNACDIPPGKHKKLGKECLHVRAVGLGKKCHLEKPFKRTQWSNMLFCPPAHRSNKQ